MCGGWGEVERPPEAEAAVLVVHGHAVVQVGREGRAEECVYAGEGRERAGREEGRKQVQEVERVWPERWGCGLGLEG